ncbi:VOC family protein [Enterococcus pingfangensis]|uniref:VOC family protein n=1 Tax=Enterococcus pingfangensis TaxID=2559924 RepID=UPI0010F44C1E|nr:VOC family protein [Enterococcus pingfangensis]
MRIEHIALWTRDIEKMKVFYEKYFNAKSTELYINPKTKFCSYFLSFESGSRLELTNKPFLSDRSVGTVGYTHLAMSVGTKADVDTFIETILSDGYPLLNGPRTTGDGYYEAVIQDPEGNLIEITTD